MKGATVLAVSSRALLDACERLGVETGPLLAAAGLASGDLDDPDARLPGEKVAALWREADARSGISDLALRAAEWLPFGAYPAIDFLCRSSTTVGEGMWRISRYFRLINSVVELPVDEGDDRVRFGVVDPRDLAGLPRLYAEYTLAAVFLRTRAAVGVAFPLLYVNLAYPAPPETHHHARLFECPVRFGAERSELVIARPVWDAAVNRGDTGLAALLERHAQMLLAELPPVSDAVGQIRAAVRRELGGGDASLDGVARKLGVSRRALQRKLADEGLTYNDVLDDARSVMARAYLGRHELSVAEIGHLLGFAEQSSFSRAFKRWTGSTPAAFRRASSG